MRPPRPIARCLLPCVLTLLLLGCAHATPAKPVYYFLIVSTEGARADVRLNDVSVAALPGARRQIAELFGCLLSVT